MHWVVVGTHEHKLSMCLSFLSSSRMKETSSRCGLATQSGASVSNLLQRFAIAAVQLRDASALHV